MKKDMRVRKFVNTLTPEQILPVGMVNFITQLGVNRAEYQVNFNLESKPSADSDIDDGYQCPCNVCNSDN